MSKESKKCWIVLLLRPLVSPSLSLSLTHTHTHAHIHYPFSLFLSHDIWWKGAVESNEVLAQETNCRLCSRKFFFLSRKKQKTEKKKMQQHQVKIEKNEWSHLSCVMKSSHQHQLRSQNHRMSTKSIIVSAVVPSVDNSRTKMFPPLSHFWKFWHVPPG